MTHSDDATEAQVQAARPDASTWLAANAGSGKTRVLTDRVARLLFDDVEPQHILCLTYTKAAASEMQNRLFKRLGAWAMLEDEELRQELRELGSESSFDDIELKKARTLFARAIETPGGLKIQTIHSFCASLLRRFPLEARVSPQFTEIEDRAADLLRAEIVDQMADSENAALITDLARHYTGEDFDKLTRAIVKHRETFAQGFGWQEALELFDLPEGFDPNDLPSRVITPDVQNWMPDACAALAKHTKTMVEMAEVLALVDYQNPGQNDLEALKSLFLFRKGKKYNPVAKTGSVPTTKAAVELGGVLDSFHGLMDRTAKAHDELLAFNAISKTLALHHFATWFLPLYEEAKTARGWLDFDDLIDRARALLNNDKVAAWVLFRIDGGIDHILVDEAQDTSPAQWDVIRKLSAEFTSGQGARQNVDRTIFVVGDKKQSIYSFQGADPREFDRMRVEFEEKFTAAQKCFQEKALAYSFRSSSAILKIVDRTFAGKADAGFGDDEQHFAFKAALPGRVDLWPLVEKQPDEEDRAWDDPLDRISPQHHDVILAERIASKIKWMIGSQQTLPDDGQGSLVRRPIQPGDFLVLVQRRSTLFSEIIRACKAHELPIAGADRLKVGGELAVQDLAALLSFLAVPEDDLSLAAALKSPLFGWSEQQLFDLAHRRTQDHLWQAMRERSAEYPETMDILRDLRRNTDFLRPFDLIERILTRHKGRNNLLARLGAEAEDGINALLIQALAYERNAVPSLTGFLVWMETDDLEIKRQIDSASNQIRVMTVHGAKGLESPIVILPETGSRKVEIKDDIIEIQGTPVWKSSAIEMPRVMSGTVDKMKAAQIEERLRLLYVALTRAQTWLIVAAAGELSKQDDTWYQMVDAALEREATETVDVDGLAVKRWAQGDWDGLPFEARAKPSAETPSLDPCFSIPTPSVPPGKTTLKPSDLGGAKALPGEAGRDEDAAKAYGTMVHRFLEFLAPATPDAWAGIIVELSTDASDAEAAAEAQFVLRAPELAPLFAAGTLAEVAVTADLGVARLSGIIDRLVVDEARVLAVDFKTNQTVPDCAKNCPEGILRQMGAYAHALTQIYPNRRIETAIVWTKTGTLMHLPHDIVMQALNSSPYLDVVAADT